MNTGTFVSNIPMNAHRSTMSLRRSDRLPLSWWSRAPATRIRLLPGATTRVVQQASGMPAFQRLHRSTPQLLPPRDGPLIPRRRCSDGTPRSHPHCERRLRPGVRLQPRPARALAERSHNQVATEENTTQGPHADIAEQADPRFERV